MTRKTNKMPANNDKYNQESLVLEALELRKLHLQLKDLMHDDKIRHQTKIPSRKEMISTSTVYTKAKEHVVRLIKSRDKKDAKAEGKPSSTKLRVVRVDEALASFLRLKERGLPADMYPDTLVTSNFTDWVVRSGLQNGKEVLLTKDGKPVNTSAADFIRLFSEDLKRAGSGPTIKAGEKDPVTGMTVTEDTLTSVLDQSGKQVRPFNMNKHMFIFAAHYPQVPKNIGGRYEKGRDVVTREDHTDIYERMQREHTLFTGDLGNARKRFRTAQDDLKKLQEKKDKALQVGDRSIQDSISRATQELRTAKQAYITILNNNYIPHNIAL